MRTIEEWYPITYKNTQRIEEAFLPHYKGEGIFLDIGTNAGAVIDRVLKHFPNAHIEGFEPVSKFWEYLDSKYKDTNVTINKFGLGHSNFKTSIHVDPTHLGWNEIGHTSSHNQDIEIKILDEVLKEKNISKGIEFIKIDVEYFQPFVIAGLKEYFEANKDNLPHIVIEHNYETSPYKQEQDQVYTWLQQYYNPFDYNNITGTQDMLLKPKNR